MTERSPSGGRLTVLYDAKCRVCTRFAGRLAGLDRGHHLRIRPLQWAERDEWESVRRLRAERDLRLALHVIDETGGWAAGGAAIVRTLERLPVFAPVAGALRLPLVRSMVEPGYRWFADHRARFAFLAGSFRNRSFGASEGVGRAQAGGTHRRVEAGQRTDGDGGDDAPDHGHGRDDGHPRL